LHPLKKKKNKGSHESSTNKNKIRKKLENMTCFEEK